MLGQMGRFSWSRFYRLALLCAGVWMLQACAGSKTTDDQTINWTPEKLYAEAKDEMSSGSFDKAIQGRLD